MTIDEFLSRLEKVKKNGSGWMARCPAHEDRHASLSVGVGDDERVLARCMAGCLTADVVAALGLTLADLFADRGGGVAFPRRAPSTGQQPSQARGCTLTDYAQAKGLPVVFLESVGVAEQSYRARRR